jgi:hypothetical protein
MPQQIEWNCYKIALLPQAVINKPPSYFTENFDIVLEDNLDSLDYYKRALLKIDGVVFALKQYRGNDQKMTTIYMSSDILEISSISGLVTKIVAALKLQKDDVAWERKDTRNA